MSFPFPFFLFPFSLSPFPYFGFSFFFSSSLLFPFFVSLFLRANLPIADNGYGLRSKTIAKVEKQARDALGVDCRFSLFYSPLSPSLFVVSSAYLWIRQLSISFQTLRYNVTTSSFNFNFDSDVHADCNIIKKKKKKEMEFQELYQQLDINTYLYKLRCFANSLRIKVNI